MELSAALLARLRAGDRAAQEALIRAFQVRVYAVCRALAGSDADDCAQDALLKLLTHLRHRDPARAAPLIAIALRIARNVCIDRARSARVRAGPALDPGTVTTPGHGDALDDARRADLVRAAVFALPDDQRAVIALRMWGELDYAEIARIEGVPVGTIRSRLSRARDALKGALEPIDNASRPRSASAEASHESPHGSKEASDV
jgi:RNA polymerase sigma-70 factor, ECF subfamily